MKNKQQYRYKEYRVRCIIFDKYTLKQYIIIKRNKNKLTLVSYPNLDKILIYDLPNNNIEYNILNVLKILEFQNLLIKLKNKNIVY